MIPTIRIDAELADLCSALRVAKGPKYVDPSTGKGMFPLSRARDGLTWVLAALGIGPDDEVLLCDLMCSTMGRAVVRAGGRIVTYGLERGTLSPSPGLCEEAVSRRTKVVVVPHLYGVYARMDDFAQIAQRHGLLLVEDCAHCFPVVAGPAECGSVGDCALYSFNYAKPLSLGWGGALGLSAELEERAGAPLCVEMPSEEDRLYAAAFLLGHTLTDAHRLCYPLVWTHIGLTLIAERSFGRGGSGSVLGLVEALLQAAEKGAEDFLEYCEANRFQAKPSWIALMRPEFKRPFKRCWNQVVRARESLMASRSAPKPDLAQQTMKIIPSGGLGARLLEAQRELLLTGKGAVSRREKAAFYAEHLDPGLWLFPRPEEAEYWLVYPVVAKRRIRRDSLVRLVAERHQVDVYPWMWPQVLHRLPRLARYLTPGPGSNECGSLVDGLLNLPVHPQMTEDKAAALVRTLNAV